MDVQENPQNPFVHHLNLSPVQKAKMVFVGLTLLPIRLVVALICLTSTTTLAYVGLYNLSNEELENKPFTGWRLMLRKVICGVLRLMYFVCGFHYVKIVGKQADPSVAKILAVAPHSSFFDSLAVVIMGAPIVVAKAETSSLPFWGSLIKYTQPVLVYRNDPSSRQNTIRQIVERSSQEQQWQQILIYPEGTCTNRSCFIPFRPGAFLPGVAVQPVLLRYSNSTDTITWTWEGLPAWKVIVYTLCQFSTNHSIEFLDPYVPNEEEVNDAKLFAVNVRAVMSDSLGIPTTDCSYFDYLRIEKSQRRGKALQKLQRRLDKPLLQTTSYIHQLDQKQARSTHERAMIAERIGATHDLPELDVVLADLMEGEQADLRHLRLSVLVCCGEDSLATFLKQTIALFDAELDSEDLRGVICGEILQTHLFLSAKETKEALESLTVNGKIEVSELEKFITITKPNHLKVLRAMENRLNEGVTDLLTKTAGLTAERMAAKLEKVAASGSILVSDMSATVAAGRDKVTDALSSAVTSLHKRTDSSAGKKDD